MEMGVSLLDIIPKNLLAEFLFSTHITSNSTDLGILVSRVGLLPLGVTIVVLLLN